MNTNGRVTIPTDMDAVPETLDLLKRWGADAIFCFGDSIRQGELLQAAGGHAVPC